ncbi:MAG: amidohydrolase family protein [Erysipelotrichaceae bacterium]|nr:amidohydrolase family protein [Erysipelotrichaceae bacterium]
MSSLLIKNGRVVDPCQQLDKITNVLINDGKICSITDDEPHADQVIDATNKIVSPGFIDIHMHEDPFVDNKPTFSMAKSALLMGVTTDIGGNCGDNNYDPIKYYEYLDKNGSYVNLGLFVGHTSLRQRFNINKYKPTTNDVIDKMTKIAKDYLDYGLLGVSFGIKYVPGSTTDELVRLASLCHESNKLVSCHVRQDEDEVFAACEELKEIARLAKVRVQFSHIGSMGGYNQMNQLLKQIDEYRSLSIDMCCDCYPYDAFCTSIGSTTYDDGFLDRYHSDYSHVYLASGIYRGQYCDEKLFNEVRNNHPNTATVGFFMKQQDIDLAFAKDYVCVGSDGTRDNGHGHPRASGSFPKFISDYIKTNKITLSEGINKMSCLAAKQIGLKNKGNLIPGSDGDITIFDLNEIQDCATYQDDLIPPKGINYVLIDGKIAMNEGNIINNNLGKAIRI